MDASGDVEPVKDETTQHPVPTAWRPALREIVEAFRRGDYGLVRGVEHVAPVSARTAQAIRRQIESYRVTLMPLPEETWDTSVTQWMGHKWEVLVDLWTLRDGSSDLVLHVDVFEAGDGFRIHIHLVYIP
jgi:hypothetical protein